VIDPGGTSPLEALTEPERRVAAEIVRLAQEELGIAHADAGGAPLSTALDSLQLLSLVVAVEDRFRVILTDDDAAGTRTLEDLARLVAARADAEVLP
jgi:acyl carrier protein